MMRKNIERSKADEELPPITGDLRALEQVFTNLISNAIEAMRDGGGIAGGGGSIEHHHLLSPAH